MILCDDLMIKDTFDMAVSYTILNQHQRNAYFVGVVGWLVVLLFYVPGKHLRSCWESQLT